MSRSITARSVRVVGLLVLSLLSLAGCITDLRGLNQPPCADAGQDRTVSRANPQLCSLADFGMVDLNGEPNIQIVTSWSNGTEPVFGELRWTMPNGARIEEGGYQREILNGRNALVESPERALDGVHEIHFRLSGPSVSAFAKVMFEVTFLNYQFTATRTAIWENGTQTVLLAVRHGCVTELANSWRLGDSAMGSVSSECPALECTVQIGSAWANSNSPIFGEIIWDLPNGARLERGGSQSEVKDGASGLADTFERAVDGEHTIAFRVAGDPAALADLAFELDFLGYRFETVRRVAGEDEFIVRLDVCNGVVVELANGWR